MSSTELVSWWSRWKGRERKKQQQLEQARQKREKEEKAKQDVHVPSTPKEVIHEMFGLDFAKEGGELDFFEWLRGECPFVWNKFWNANENELNKMDEDAWTRRKEVIRLFCEMAVRQQVD